MEGSHPKFQSFEVGNYVLKSVQARGNLNINKLSAKYMGPLKIVKVNRNGVTYVVADNEGDTLRAHHDDLIKFNQPPRYLRDHL